MFIYGLKIGHGWFIILYDSCHIWNTWVVLGKYRALRCVIVKYWSAPAVLNLKSGYPFVAMARPCGRLKKWVLPTMDSVVYLFSEDNINFLSCRVMKKKNDRYEAEYMVARYYSEKNYSDDTCILLYTFSL